MSNKLKDSDARQGHESRVTRNRKQKYSKDVYGARVPHEDARILDDYGKANKLERSDVVRMGLHQFALRQQMRYHKKDPLREMTEQVIAEKIEPLYNRVAEMAAMLHGLAGAIAQMNQISSAQASARNSAEALSSRNGVEAVPAQAQLFKEQKQLIEKTLMAAMLALRLHVNYVVEPIIRRTNTRSGDDVEAYLQAAIRGREEWSEVTREVITRTGNRILFELNLITKEDWEKLLNVYRSQTSGGAAR